MVAQIYQCSQVLNDDVSVTETRMKIVFGMESRSGLVRKRFCLFADKTSIFDLIY